jgi:peptidyl-prolyl cis-trans isomerase D
VNAVNTTGYISFESVKEYLTEQVKNEKKAEKILSQLADASTIDGAVKSAKAVADTIKHVSFAVPTFVSSTTASEPIIGAVAAKTDVKKVSKPFKGYRGVYMLEVLAKNKTAETFDADAESKSMSDQWFRMAVNNLMNDLTKDAEVEDLRYKFY